MIDGCLGSKLANFSTTEPSTRTVVPCWPVCGLVVFRHVQSRGKNIEFLPYRVETKTWPPFHFFFRGCGTDIWPTVFAPWSALMFWDYLRAAWKKFDERTRRRLNWRWDQRIYIFFLHSLVEIFRDHTGAGAIALLTVKAIKSGDDWSAYLNGD